MKAPAVPQVFLTVGLLIVLENGALMVLRFTALVAQGIRCNAICLGTVDSPSLQQRLRDTGDYEAARAAFIARQLIGRIGTAQEIANLVLYLATATYTTGQAHVIDGGWTG